MGWGGGEGRGGDAYLPLINHDFKINIIKFGVRVYTYLDYLLGGGEQWQGEIGDGHGIKGGREPSMGRLRGSNMISHVTLGELG